MPCKEEMGKDYELALAVSSVTTYLFYVQNLDEHQLAEIVTFYVKIKSLTATKQRRLLIGSFTFLISDMSSRNWI